MAAGYTAFYSLWQDRDIRETLFDLLAKEDICAVRLANSACCNLVTKRLFLRIQATFNANTFTKPSRVQALSRVGHHIEHLTFHFAHSDATFLPPLIHPHTGVEIPFLYTPHTSMASVLSRPKYGTSELGDILMQQYPPLFHAASNVPSFINAMKHMRNIRHVTIRTPGQDPKERYRRDSVEKLSLSAVHPSAFNYLRHVPGFGASPASARLWRQIRKLYISVESWDFYGRSPGLDHLKIIDDFVRSFTPSLEKFAFTWLGRKGPCPLALSGDPLFAPPRNTRKLFNEVTSPMSPLPARPSRRPLVMPQLRYMQVRNATMNAPQLAGLVVNHKDSVREFDFENVVLINGGSWDEALAPLSEPNSKGCSDTWSRHSIGRGSDSSPCPRASSSGSPTASSLECDQLPSPSAAAAAASKELFDVDLEGMAFGGMNDVDALEVGVEEWARGVHATAQDGGMVPDPTLEADEEADAEDDGGLASDIEAAREASLAFSTKIKKRRIRKKSSRVHHSGDHDAEHGEHHRSHHSSRTHHKHSRSDGTHDRRHRSKSGSDRRGSHRSPSRHSDKQHHHHSRHRRSRVSGGHQEMPCMPEVIGSDDESFGISGSKPGADISAPILNQNPLPVLLQPTIYDPSSKAGPFLRSASADVAETSQGDGLSSTQRSIEADLLADAEEAAARSSAMKRAKEAVLTKLSREFCKRKPGGQTPYKTDSAAVVASVSSLQTSLGAVNAPLTYGSSIGFRLRENLFGRYHSGAVSDARDHRSLESQSQSALVPLMFSRS